MSYPSLTHHLDVTGIKVTYIYRLSMRYIIKKRKYFHYKLKYITNGYKNLKLQFHLGTLYEYNLFVLHLYNLTMC